MSDKKCICCDKEIEAIEESDFICATTEHVCRACWQMVIDFNALCRKK